MQAFWSAGYEGASVPLLAGAMGISVQSLYAAFGSKEALFREALDYYSRTVGGFGARALEAESDAIRAVIRFLDEAAVNFARTTGTPGCMIATAAAEVAEPSLSAYARQLRTDSVARISARLKRGVQEGQMSAGFDCDHWAWYIASVMLGMSVQARDGATADVLHAVARIAAASIEANRRG
ncbi:TetR/AcrR family transcriptional regulator [Mitsuaria sp. 7]|uniref:TetR/AcrR family transcriptional regulator n=1 Tax=Mitsuaria sp. 7 TaxID=1658665 RepID=UPI000B281082|nr:TetR/AcrR family transcriptional regulator [Mitsuaria sp. 7]